MPKALIVEILADAKQFGAELDRAAGKTRSFGKAAGVAGLALGGALAYGMEKSVKSAMDFQSSMTLLSTQAGVATDQVKGLSQGVLALAGPTATAPDELAKGIYHLASQGLRGAQALDALKIAAEGAKVGQANLEDVTNALGATLVSGIKGAKNLSGAMGDLNATVGAGDMRMQDLADAMGTGLAANARVAGVSLAQVSAALAVFGDNNIRGAKAGTLLSSTMRVMGHQSTAAAKALADIGVSSTTLQQKLSTQGLTGAIDYLKERIAATHKPLYQVSSDLSEAFGGKQATGIKLLLAESERLHKKLDEVKAGASGFGQAWQQTTETTRFKFDQMKAAMDSVAINLGSALLPAVTAAANAIANMTQWMSKHTTITKILVAAVGTLAVGLIALSAATWAVNVAMAANPVGAVIVGIVALTAAIVILVTHFKEVKAWVTAHWPEVAAVMLLPIAPILSVGLAIYALRDKIKGALGEVVHFLQGVFAPAFNAVKNVAMHVWDGVKAVWNATIGAEIQFIVGLVKTLIHWLEEAASLVSKVAHAASSVGHAITGGGSSSTQAPGPFNPGPGHGGMLPKSSSGVGGNLSGFSLGGLSSAQPQQGSMVGGDIHVHVGPINGTADSAFAKTLAAELATQLRGGRVPQLQQAIQAI